MDVVKEGWDRMSKGYPLPRMVLVYKDGTIRDILTSYQCFVDMRHKQQRPVTIEVLEDVLEEVYYKVLRRAVSPCGGKVVLKNDAKVI